jgi:disulfide oxidoreductase YuzD
VPAGGARVPARRAKMPWLEPSFIRRCPDAEVKFKYNDQLRDVPLAEVSAIKVMFHCNQY